MARIKPNATIAEYQNFIREVYGLPNDRHFSPWDMLTHIERFMMRGLKGVRKNDKKKIKFNLLISLSWFMSLMNQFHIDVEDEIWKRFPYLCSWCGFLPCVCRKKKPEKRREISTDNKKRPNAFKDFQEMFRRIYPPQKRTLEQAGIHLAEEIGEFSEALLAFRGGRKDADFKKVAVETADLFSCFAGVFNSLNADMAKELSIMFSNNCHICKKAPCECDFESIVNFKS